MLHSIAKTRGTRLNTFPWSCNPQQCHKPPHRANKQFPRARVYNNE